MSKVWFITGATRGIGAEIAKSALKAGHQVVATGRKPEKVTEALGTSDNLLVAALDVTREEKVKSAVKAAIDRFGRIDVLVNNAGLGILGAAEESSIAQAQSLFDTNFFGVIRVTNEVLPHMRHRGSGRIINISSVLGYLPAPYGALYSASKHAVEGYTESLDHELREYGVRALLVEPGYTRTAF